jgi:hypothetical protein
MMRLTIVLLTLWGSDAAMSFIQSVKYADMCGGTSTGTNVYGVTNVCRRLYTGNMAQTFIKQTCNTTHTAQQIYTDYKCATKATTEGNYADQAIACNTSKGEPSTTTCDNSLDMAIGMVFSDSTCTDANFVGFDYLAKDTCASSGSIAGQSSGSFYKWVCTTAVPKKLELKWYSDKTCATALTSDTVSYDTTTCNADPLDPMYSSSSSNSSNSSRRLAPATYIKLYLGCGLTGKLPTGITAPATTNSDGSGQVSGARGILGSLPVMVIAMLLALK